LKRELREFSNWCGLSVSRPKQSYRERRRLLQESLASAQDQSVNDMTTVCYKPNFGTRD